MQKILYVPAINADVIVARRKGTRHMRISMLSDGRVRLSIPWSVSEIQAMRFLISKSEWIKEHKKETNIINHDDHIGKSHRVVFKPTEADKVRTYVRNNQITISIPQGVSFESSEAQTAVRKASEKALSKEATNLLPQRLQVLATKHNINYKDVTAKKLRSRWGSCDSNKSIVLNIYLMQLDWELIDYVILHELAHTRFQHHQSDFWNFLESICPDYNAKRKALKQKPTAIIDTKF